MAPYLACVAVAAFFLFPRPADAQPAFVGSEVCQACHEDISKNFPQSAHRAIERRKGWEKQACESCHGPGAKHAESAAPADIRNPRKLPTAEADRSCMSCHRGKPASSGRIQGGHAGDQVSCASCHTVHQSEEALVSRAPAAVNAQCATCHESARAEFQRPHAHRLPQGAMKCTDCHNPHGSFLAKSIQTVSSNEPGCLKCHGDKRGPFVFEHAPVRLEGCGSCHEPHGSANPRMLKRHDIQLQCLECHANLGSAGGTLGGQPPAFHDLRSARFRNCTTCHVKIHGSHVSRALLR